MSGASIVLHNATQMVILIKQTGSSHGGAESSRPIRLTPGETNAVLGLKNTRSSVELVATNPNGNQRSNQIRAVCGDCVQVSHESANRLFLSLCNSGSTHLSAPPVHNDPYNPSNIFTTQEDLQNQYYYASVQQGQPVSQVQVHPVQAQTVQGGYYYVTQPQPQSQQVPVTQIHVLPQSHPQVQQAMQQAVQQPTYHPTQSQCATCPQQVQQVQSQPAYQQPAYQNPAQHTVQVTHVSPYNDVFANPAPAPAPVQHVPVYVGAAVPVHIQQAAPQPSQCGCQNRQVGVARTCGCQNQQIGATQQCCCGGLGATQGNGRCGGQYGQLQTGGCPHQAQTVKSSRHRHNHNHHGHHHRNNYN